MKRPSGPGSRHGARAAAPAPASLGDREIETLQALLDAVPAPLEPLDVSSLDGFLCGVIVQPTAIAPARWLRFITDVDGRALPAGFDARPLHALVVRRDAELRRAIGRRLERLDFGEQRVGILEVIDVEMAVEKRQRAGEHLFVGGEQSGEGL